MKTTMKITLRAFPVKIQDTRTGKTTEDKIILTKEQLHAADLVGQSSKMCIRDRPSCGCRSPRM